MCPNANAFKDQKRPTMRASKQFRGEAMDVLSRCYRQVAAATHLQEGHILTTLEEAVSNEGYCQAQPSNYTLDIEGDDLVIGVLYAMLSKTTASKTTRLLG